MISPYICTYQGVTMKNGDKKQSSKIQPKVEIIGSINDIDPKALQTVKDILLRSYLKKLSERDDDKDSHGNE